jgi:hypothetical protein
LALIFAAMSRWHPIASMVTMAPSIAVWRSAQSSPTCVSFVIGRGRWATHMSYSVDVRESIRHAATYVDIEKG